MGRRLPLLGCCAPIARPTLSEEEAAGLERLFKALADRNRLKIVNALVQCGDDAVCVCDFQAVLGLAQPTVSHHLRVLTDAGLLERERRGTYAYYRLAPHALERLTTLVAPPRRAAA